MKSPKSVWISDLLPATLSVAITTEPLPGKKKRSFVSPGSFWIGFVLTAAFCVCRISGAVCVKEAFDLEDFEIDIEVQGSCECCYGEYCRYGILISFWEPHRIIETVKDPYCSPTDSASSLLEDHAEGASLLEKLHLGGTHSHHANTEDATVFAQTHYLTHPTLTAIRMVMDGICSQFSDSGLDYISEEDHEWQDLYSSSLFPEAGLFASLSMVKACMADALSSQVGAPIDPLYWCMGAWGNLFNMNGHINQDEYVSGNAGLAARTIALMGRKGYLMDAATDYCHAIPMPFWVKSYFKLQPLRPTERTYRVPIGQAYEMWGPGLNLKKEGDNFAWLLWRYRLCCAF